MCSSCSSAIDWPSRSSGSCCCRPGAAGGFARAAFVRGSAGMALMIGEPPRGQCRMSRPSTHPFDRLTPDTVLDALDVAGLRGDGRLITLNSFENRVYQVALESPFEGHDVVVAKFYR